MIYQRWAVCCGPEEYPLYLKVFRYKQDAHDFCKEYPKDKLYVKEYD